MNTLIKIKVLENAIYKLNNAIDIIEFDNYIICDKSFKNTIEYVNKYNESNQVNCDIDDIIEDLKKKIIDISELFELDLKEEYETAINENIKVNGKIEITEPKKEIKEYKNDNIISLGDLSEDRKIIKSSIDKLYKIIDNEEDKKDTNIIDAYFKLNNINECIKDNKKVELSIIKNDLNTVLSLLNNSKDIYISNKRRLNTICKIYNDIFNILFSIGNDNKNIEEYDDLPF